MIKEEEILHLNIIFFYNRWIYKLEKYMCKYMHMNSILIVNSYVMSKKVRQKLHVVQLYSLVDAENSAILNLVRIKKINI